MSSFLNYDIMLKLCLVMFCAMMGQENAASFPFCGGSGDVSGVNSLLNFWMISWWLNVHNMCNPKL